MRAFDRQPKAPEELRGLAHSLTGSSSDYDPLLDWIGSSRFVLLGEATHGTREFYRERARITRRLIEEKGFNAVAVEADWPDAFRIHRYVTGKQSHRSARAALHGFQRFPCWMWANANVLDFIQWLRGYNDALSAGTTKAGFYGLDLYSVHASMKAVLAYLAKIDPEAAQRARFRYSCFDHFGEDPQSYGYATSYGLTESCGKEVVRQLVELRRGMLDYARRDGQVAEEEFFFAEQNARLVKNAEEYYRAMFGGHIESWNVRDRHTVQLRG